MKKCPVPEEECPYLLKNGECSLAEPEEDCEDFYFWNS